MVDSLFVTLIQSHLHWENPEANRAHFSKLIGCISEETHLIVLPEMFTTGFTMNAEPLGELPIGPTLGWMREIAKNKNAAITGSIIVHEKDRYFNRLLFVLPDGSFKQYDKKHTFTLAGEHKVYASGTQRILVELLGWKICPLVCYDLRFPVWARNTVDYDLLLYVANWPKKRIAAWDALLKARAIENMSYCLGLNRVGLDGNGHEYVGHSAVYDVLGEQVTISSKEEEFIETVQLKKEHIQSNRAHLQFLNDRDQFSLK